jgi:hypothetical protein
LDRNYHPRFYNVVERSGETMKAKSVTVVAIAVVSLVASSAFDANAKGYAKSHKHHHANRHDHRYAVPDHGYKQAYPDASGWFPHDSNQLQFGSKLWWEQMEREGRLNRDSN